MLITIATRKSALALWQANEVSRLLCKQHADLKVELLTMTTSGDRFLQDSLAEKGGKGLFVKELENGLLNKSADIAVHSMKDVPMELPDGLHLPVILEREHPGDAFVSNSYTSLDDLPQDAIVGTSSVRRESQLKALRPDLQIKLLRGNVNTRLNKLDANEYDAIILAVAGLTRLGFQDRIRSQLSMKNSLPAIGQGAIGIECRIQDQTIESIIQPLNHEATNICVTAERAVSRALQGGCQLPIAGFANLENDQIRLRARVGSLDGSKFCNSDLSGKKNEPEKLGQQVADDLISQGADRILAELT